MKRVIPFIVLYLISYTIVAQKSLYGIVLSKYDEKELQFATVRLLSSGYATATDYRGIFTITTSVFPDTLLISYVGYKSIKLPISVDQKMPITAFLEEDASSLEELIVSTGYYNTIRGNATGSFDYINNDLINRSVSSDIISRLEGIVSGLQFDRRLAGDIVGRDNSLSLRLRGLSTIYANSEPLIVVDDYPYEGDISSINPNNIQSVTILKDAAAASIWGVKAGNGVIVVKTKSGEYSKPLKIAFNTNMSISKSPDLDYNSKLIDSPSYIELEKILFSRNLYANREADINKAVLSPVIEALIAERDGLKSKEEVNQYLQQLKEQNILQEARDLLYRNSINQQYAINISGGANRTSYFLSGGYDKNVSWSKGNENDRITLNALNSFKPISKLEFSTNIAYVLSKSYSNAVDIRSLSIFPYSSLRNSDGTSASIPRDYRLSYVELAEREGLVNWEFKPLDELELNNKKNVSQDSRFGINLKYNFSQELLLNLGYQFHNILAEGRNLQDKNSYYVRNLVNRFTQPSGQKIFPYGDILSTDYSRQRNQTFRGQLNYSKKIKEVELNSIAGFEVRENSRNSNSFTFYGYDDEVLTARQQLDYLTYYQVRPVSTSTIPFPGYSLSSTIDRYLSYYGNILAHVNSKYILSGSLRWDASNLFGVETNQKGVPLWSAGINWKIGQESFYTSKKLPVLNLRFTYGYSGNIDKSVTAFTTVSYSTSFTTGLPQAVVSSPGNKNLRWEKINTINIGLDYGLKNNKVHGYIEFYKKFGTDLVGTVLIDPTIFYPGNLSTYKINYADLINTGIDVALNVSNVGTKLKWNSNILFSYASNKVTNYAGEERGTVTSYVYGNTNRPVVGESLDELYSLPWAGLDPDTGDPLVNEGGVLTKEYTRYINGLTISDLVKHGSSVPLFTGSVRNSLSIKGFTISANVTFKAAYFYRRRTVNYTTIINSGNGMHPDYLLRWQNKGDETHTIVPSIPNGNVANRDNVYALSEALVNKGDHIRLQDIAASYQFGKSRKIQIYSYLSNLGIIWKADGSNIDPDYPYANILPPKAISLGLKIDI